MPAIVQCAREIGAGYGVSGPALRLEQEFKRLGYDCGRLTLADLGLAGPAPRSRIGTVARLWRDILVFSFVAPIVAWWRYRSTRRDIVFICHVDALAGDIFVVRALPKSAWRRHPHRWHMLLKNPLHLLLLARDAIRFRSGIHRRIVALSDAGRAEILSLYPVTPSSVSVIPNGVDLHRFRPSAEHRHAVRAELGIDEATFVLLFAGNEFERKGLRPSLLAIDRLCRDGIACHLIVAGRDDEVPYRGAIADVRDAVSLVGHVQDVERYFAAADALLLPASFDVSPLVGREGLASGLPLLMTDVGGVRDYLRDGENGFFVTTDAGDIAAKVRLLAGDRARLANMAEVARTSAAGSDWSAIARQYAALVEAVAAERALER